MNNTTFQRFRIVFGLLVAVATVRIFNADLGEHATENKRKLQTDAVSSAKHVYDVAAKSVVYIDCFGLQMSVEEEIPQMSGPRIPGPPMTGPQMSKEDELPNQRILAQKTPRQTALDRKTGNLEGKIVPISSGSGYIWDEGIVLTNYHLVQGCTDIEISLLSTKDESEENDLLFPTSLQGRDPSIDEPVEYHWKVVTAKVAGADPDTDIAVLKFNASNVNGTIPVMRGDDKKSGTGEDCFAIGNPFGLDHSITRGIISAKGRVHICDDGEPMTDLIQTDASINSGNSGGPLLNSQGEMIGMNTMFLSESGSSSGIGLAIPISTIIKISDAIINEGRVVRPKFGVKFGMELQAYFGISEGALVYEVYGPGEKSGLLPTISNANGSVDLGDIIIKIDGIKIDSDLDAYEVINKHKSGDKVDITIRRWQHKKDKYVVKKLRMTLE